MNWRIGFVRQAQESATLNTSVHVHCFASLARQASCAASASRALERRQTSFHPRLCDDSLKSLHRRVVENRAQVQQGQVVLNNAVIGRNFDTGFYRVLKLRTSSWRGFLRKSWPYHKFGVGASKTQKKRRKRTTLSRFGENESGSRSRNAIATYFPITRQLGDDLPPNRNAWDHSRQAIRVETISAERDKAFVIKLVSNGQIETRSRHAWLVAPRDTLERSHIRLTCCHTSTT